MNSQRQGVESDISLNLGRVSLKFNSNGWGFDNEEFDRAAGDIEKVLNERDALLTNIQDILTQMNALREELTEVNREKCATLDLVRVPCMSILPYFLTCSLHMLLIEEKRINSILERPINLNNNMLRKK